jgi:DNA-binding transcriptional LysR family regulator
MPLGEEDALRQLVHPLVHRPDETMDVVLLPAERLQFETVFVFHVREFAPAHRIQLIVKNNHNIDFLNALPMPALNVHHLELFYYVARAGGITPALKLIPYGIQQPAVSSQVAQLEDAVGAKLFHRRPFSITPVGREVFEFIAPFFGGLPQLAGNVQGKSGAQLRLAATAGMLRDYFPPLLRELEQRVPGLRLSLREATPAAAARLLREHQADLAFALHEARHAEGLQFEPLLKLPLMLLVGSDAPFHSAAAVLKEAAGGGLPLIAPPPGDALTDSFHGELKKRRLKWEVRIEAPVLDLVEAYVRQGFGIGLTVSLPGRTIPPGTRALKLNGFPQLMYGMFTHGRITAPAQVCMELARKFVKAL